MTLGRLWGFAAAVPLVPLGRFEPLWSPTRRGLVNSQPQQATVSHPSRAASPAATVTRQMSKNPRCCSMQTHPKHPSPSGCFRSPSLASSTYLLSWNSGVLFSSIRCILGSAVLVKVNPFCSFGDLAKLTSNHTRVMNLLALHSPSSLAWAL